ncbi:unnamed protein product [Phytophthora lilii]|uniref:Unnamed protein product n=1 Tax=Phytophthora lilii TaxID=2077276 RepID=A0A9W6U7S9_9STRA|nr:unnamed protein product [Phytophthora lilii]
MLRTCCIKTFLQNSAGGEGLNAGYAENDIKLPLVAWYMYLRAISSVFTFVYYCAFAADRLRSRILVLVTDKCALRIDTPSCEPATWRTTTNRLRACKKPLNIRWGTSYASSSPRYWYTLSLPMYLGYGTDFFKDLSEDYEHKHRDQLDPIKTTLVTYKTLKA